MSDKITITDSPSNLVLGALTVGAIGIVAGVIFTFARIGSRSSNGIRRGLNDGQTRRQLSNQSKQSENDDSDDSDIVIVMDSDILERKETSLSNFPEVNPYIITRATKNFDDRVEISTDGMEITDVGYLRPEQIESIIRARGKEIRMNAPIILRQQFGQKGYAIIQNNLSQTNTKLNEFAELMRMDGLSILNGCEDPDNCKCNFRHKRCRLFIARLDSYPESERVNSSSDERNNFKFYSSNCEGIMRIHLDDNNNNAFLSNSAISDNALSDTESVDSAQSDDDSQGEVKEDSLSRAINHTLNQSLKKMEKLNHNAQRVSSKSLRKLVNLFEKDFTDSCVSIIEYLHYVIGVNSLNYTADIIFIADPYYEGYSHTQDNGYGRPDRSCDHTCDDNCSDKNHEVPKLDNDAMTCCMDWHQDIFCDPESDVRHPYDYVALFILDGKDITHHQLLIGKAEYDSASDIGSDTTSDQDARLDKMDIEIDEIMSNTNIEVIDAPDSDEDNNDSNSDGGSNEIDDQDIANRIMISTVDADNLPRSPVPLPPAPKTIRQVYSIDLRSQCSDIGYIINQGRDLFHRHSQFSYNSTESRRNVMAIRFKYYDR